MKEKNLLGNAVFLIALQGVGYLIPLISFPYLTNTLQDDGYGRLNTALTIIQYVAMGTDFGFNISASKNISENRADAEAVKSIFWNTMYAKIVIFGALIFLSTILVFTISKFDPIIYLYFCMFPHLIGSVMFPLWYFQGVEYIKLSSIMCVVGKLVTLPLLLLCVKSPDDINSAAFIISTPLLFSFFIGFPLLFKNGVFKPIKLNIKRIFWTIFDSAPYFAGNLAIHIYILSTPLILSLVSTYDEVGYYSATDKIRSAFVGLIILLGQSIYPRVVFWFKYDKEKYFKFMKIMLMIQVPLSIVGALCFFWIIPKIVPYVLGLASYNTVPLLETMAPMLFLIPSSFILANYLIIPNGHSKGYAIIPWIVAVIHLPTSVILCQYYGAYGGSISILITEIISLLLLIAYCIKTKLYNLSGNK